MAAFAAMPLFTDAYLGDTKHLSCAQHGAYLQLLIAAWRSKDCSVPNDDARLAKLVGLRLNHWLAMKPVVMEFWDLADERWTQKRLLKEFDYTSRKVRLRREFGARGGAAKALKEKGLSLAKAKAKALAPTPTPTPTPKDRVPLSKDNGSEDPQKALYRRGKEVLGPKAGGEVTKLLKAKSNVISMALSVIEAAAGKENPNEYVAAAIKRAANGSGLPKKTYAI